MIRLIKAFVSEWTKLNHTSINANICKKWIDPLGRNYLKILLRLNKCLLKQKIFRKYFFRKVKKFEQRLFQSFLMRFRSLSLLYIWNPLNNWFQNLFPHIFESYSNRNLWTSVEMILLCNCSRILLWQLKGFWYSVDTSEPDPQSEREYWIEIWLLWSTAAAVSVLPFK